MDIPEQKYKRKIQIFKPLLSNVISQYPIPLQTTIEPVRNLKYIVQKQKYSAILPYTFHDDFVQELHVLLSSKEVQTKMLALRISRCLPFICRLKIIEQNQNELNNMVSPKNLSLKKIGSNDNEHHYEVIADLCELLLSVYELTYFSDDIYFDVNQKITSVFSRILENCFSFDKSVARNSYEALRTIFMTFGYISKKQEMPHNKLIRKILQIFEKQPNYTLQAQSASNSSSLRLLILKTREYEIRIRCRMLTGICYLVTYLEQENHELYELLFSQLFIMIENANEFDINYECFLGIRAIISVEGLKFDVRNRMMKKWVQLISELSYKKEYFEFYVKVIQQAAKCPLRFQYYISTNYLQITSGIQQQFSRFIIYKFACRNIMSIANSDKQSSNSKDISHNIIINMFEYSWFIDRINQDGDLFRSQFLICLLHAFFFNPVKSRIQEIHDLLSLCHRLLDWKCSSKEETHIPTIKFAFDLYIQFLKEAANVLGNAIQNYIIQLIDRCNEQNIYFLFKYKLIGTITSLECYKVSIIAYSETKLNLSLLEGQIRPFMMPKNHKPIFDYEYSLSADGEIESRKQIQAIKVIMSLLASVQEVHQNLQQIVNSIIVDYHQYLGKLEEHRSSNRDLINCLQSLEADNYFSECQRSFLQALIDSQDTKGNNIQYTIDNTIIHSPFQTYDCDEEVNAFGNMSPVQLKIKILGGRSYSSVYIQVKKHQWVGTPDMKLVISSALETKELPFESGIVEIKIDRIGLLNFQAWTLERPCLLLGSGSYKIKRKFKWMKVNHLSIIDGIRSKAFFKQNDKKKAQDSTYLTYCYGQPIMIQTIQSRSEIVATVSSKQVWQQMQQIVVQMVEELTEKLAQVIQ